MRALTLNALRAGIERLRDKGGAKPDALYDLVNGYVTIDGAVRSRPGTRTIVQLPPGTKGLCAFDDKLVVFSHEAQAIPASTPPTRCEQVIHPTNPAQPIVEIHFAGPFLGALYVAAEFEDALVRHYWLRSVDTWATLHTYTQGALVQPSTPNGFVYRARRLRAAGAVWAAGVQRAVGDRVEPTTFNGFDYECIDTLGTTPRSGSTEPTWPTVEGGIVTEDAGLATAPTDVTTGTNDPGAGTLDPDTQDRYGSRYNGDGVERQAL